MARVTWLIIGVVALAVGSLGIVLPLVPTTPLVLLAAFAFANSSERLHTWLVEHNIFGPLIDNWRRYGAISRRAKALSVLSLLALVVISLLLDVPAWIIALQIIVLAVCAIFIVSRPLPPET